MAGKDRELARRNGKKKERTAWRTPQQAQTAEAARVRGYEHKNPVLSAKVAGLLPEYADNIHRFLDAAEACGMPRAMALALKKRMETRYTPATDVLRQVTSKSLLEFIDDRSLKALEYMDDASFAEASLRDLAFAASVLLEKRQLLRGEPTQILSIDERENLNDVIPAIVREAQRRGMLIDNNPMLAQDEEGQQVTVLPEPTRRGNIDSTYRRLHGFPESIE